MVEAQFDDDTDLKIVEGQIKMEEVLVSIDAVQRAALYFVGTCLIQLYDSDLPAETVAPLIDLEETISNSSANEKILKHPHYGIICRFMDLLAHIEEHDYNEGQAYYDYLKINRSAAFGILREVLVSLLSEIKELPSSLKSIQHLI